MWVVEVETPLINSRKVEEMVSTGACSVFKVLQEPAKIPTPRYYWYMWSVRPPFGATKMQEPGWYKVFQAV